MKTRGAGAFIITLVLFLLAFAMMIRVVGASDWVMQTLQGVAQSFYIATGWRPMDLFANVSLATEARTYAEVLASNWYLQMYFIGGGICALLSAVFILRANSAQLWRYHAAFVAFMILLLLPVALTTVTYSEIFAARSITYICFAVLLLLGSFSCYELMRVRTKGVLSKAAQALILLLVLAQGVVIPVLYGTKYLFNA